MTRSKAATAVAADTGKEGRGGGPPPPPPRCNLVGAYLGQIRAHQVASRRWCEEKKSTREPQPPELIGSSR
jgi:hypothetical protein